MPCSECGAPVAGREACNALMEELHARSSGDARYLIVHRVAVDAYALQHPVEHCESAKSMAAHLIGLCCAVEHGGSLAVYSRMRNWLAGSRDLQPLTPPAAPGAMTVADVAAAADLDEHLSQVRLWAASVWQAWSAHHDVARDWIAELRA